MKYLGDIVAFTSHFLTALLVIIGHRYVEEVPVFWQWVLLVMFVFIVFFLYKKIRESRALGKKEVLQQEMKKLKRYNHLRKSMLMVMGDFIKERCRMNVTITNQLQELINSGNVTSDTVRNVLSDADNVRREKVKQSLGKVVQLLHEDLFKKPKDSDGDSMDKMGVSFYARESTEDGEVLVNKSRHFPNEQEPKTKFFKQGQGAAGVCWRDRKLVICENGGEDPAFEELRDKQKEEYASMICVPAIADFPQQGFSEVYGVLTIHSRKRRGYFEKQLEDFWFDLFQPVCDALVFSAKSSEMIKAIGNSISKEDPQE